MSFSITESATIAAIRAAYNSSNWPLAYQLVFDAITNPFAPGTPLPGVDPAVAAWINGARKVNLDSGPFASYIRDYTARQFELRTGQNPGEGAIQAASDLIAKRFIADLFGELAEPDDAPPPSLPPPSDPGKIYASLELKSLQRVGAIDAAAAAANIFQSTTSDNTANFSPWAGTQVDRAFFMRGLRNGRLYPAPVLTDRVYRDKIATASLQCRATAFE
jgi:hypothetical protein